MQTEMVGKRNSGYIEWGLLGKDMDNRGVLDEEMIQMTRGSQKPLLSPNLYHHCNPEQEQKQAWEPSSLFIEKNPPCPSNRPPLNVFNLAPPKKKKKKYNYHLTLNQTHPKTIRKAVFKKKPPVVLNNFLSPHKPPSWTLFSQTKT